MAEDRSPCGLALTQVRAGGLRAVVEPSSRLPRSGTWQLAPATTSAATRLRTRSHAVAERIRFAFHDVASTRLPRSTVPSRYDVAREGPLRRGAITFTNAKRAAQRVPLPQKSPTEPSAFQ